jgi:hypothetical protein
MIRTLDFDGPDRAPRHLWSLAGVGMLRRDELDAVKKRFPDDMTTPAHRYGPSVRAKGEPSQVGEYTDEWGCVWTVAEVGVCGEIKRPILDDWSALETWSPPWERLEQADFSMTNASCRDIGKFTMAGYAARVFERLQFLRGTENLFVDLMMQPPELLALRDLVHAYNLRDVELWCDTDVDAVFLMDDWGSQNGLLISPALWRSFFKPLYKEYCDLAKQAGKYVFFHSDGYTMDIIPDLIEIGVDALNTQIFCMDIEELGRRFKGKLTFWGEICRQHVMPFGTVDEVRQAVRRVRRALDDGRGGVIAQCEWGVRDPKENVEAVFETWLEPLEAAAGS